MPIRVEEIMAKNKQNPYFGKDFVEDNHNTEDFIDNNLDYDDFLNDLDNDNFYQPQDQDYNENYDDNNYQEDYIDDYQNQEILEDYPAQDYSDDYIYEDNQQYDDYQTQPLPVDTIDQSDAEEINELLKNISDKLERLESRKKREVAPNVPFYAPNTMPYVFIPSQNSGNEVILNELAKLREENYRMQHSQEIQRQLNALKDELNTKLAALNKTSKEQKQQIKQNQEAQAINNQSVLLEELQKLNQKIEQLESKTKSEDINQILELINRLETKINSKGQERLIKTDGDDSYSDIINQIKNVSLKNDDVLAYIKSIRHALGLSAISHINEDGEVDYSNLKEEYAEFKKIINTGNLYAKITAISKFNELIAELPVGIHDDIASDFFRIRNKVFGTILTPEVAAELIYNSTESDKERDIYYYFELKSELDRANSYDLPQVAEKFLKLRNRLQNNQYVTYNQNLFNDLIDANNDYEFDKTALAKERLEKAKEIFSTLRIGDIVPINDYSKIRPSINYKSISDKLNELQKLIKEKDANEIIDLQSKLDLVIGEIKTVFGEKTDANFEQINKVLNEVNALKESIVVLSEQRHTELIQEFANLKQELEQTNISTDLEYIKAQVLNLQEELKAKNINNEIIFNAVNEIKEQFSALSDYSDYADYDTPSVSNEALLDEIRALKEQIYIQKGEFDPEILVEVRNLKDLLTTTRKEESYKDIIDGLNRLQETIEKNTLAENQNYETVLTSALELLSAQVEQLTQKTELLSLQDNDQLLKEIEAIKSELKTIIIPTVIHEGEKVKIDYTELQQQLDILNANINRLAEIPKDESNRDFAVNVFRESMIEVLNEITNLKDEYIYQSEKSEALSSEINAIKEQISQYFEDAAQKTEITLLNEINQIKDLVTASAAVADSQLSQDLLSELNAVKEQLTLNTQSQETILKAYKSDNTQILKNITELKENFLIGKSDTDNTFIIETASIREQLNALKQTLDFDKISQDIGQLKQAVQNTKPEIDIDTIRQVIKDEINNSKSAELAVSIAAIERQITELKKEFARRQESDTATLDFMSKITTLLENQNDQDATFIDDIQKLKKEIELLKSQKDDNISEESQRFAKRLTALKEDLSKIAQIADLEERQTNALDEAVALLDTDTQEQNQSQQATSDISQKEFLRKQLLEGGVSEDNVNEILNSLFPEEDR